MATYIDRLGKVVLNTSGYDDAGSFSEGLAGALVRYKGWGFIDKTGALVIPPRYESYLNFSEGLAAVVLDGKWGFIDKRGTMVIPNQFAWVAGFSEGVAVVQRSSKPPQIKPAQLDGPVTFITEVWDLTIDPSGNDWANDDEFLLIDTSGRTIAVLDDKKVVVNIDYARFSEGLLCAYSPEQDATGYINKDCEFVIQPQFAEAAPFSEGLARVAVRKEGNEKLGFIDKKGEFVIPPKFNTDFDFLRNSSDFSEGLAAVSEGPNPSQTKADTFVYIDKTGEIVLATEFFYAAEFRDGLAAIYNAETNRSGFIDTTGKIVIPVQYEIVNDFSDGLALVMI